MLCGLYAPDNGTAYIMDQDIRKSMDKIRQSIGFCPQQNILYDELTVRQHFALIASVKKIKQIIFFTFKILLFLNRLKDLAEVSSKMK